jgi:hypothetical protein
LQRIQTVTITEEVIKGGDRHMLQVVAPWKGELSAKERYGEW